MEEKLAWEKELIGFYLSEHPLHEHIETIKKYGAKPIADLMAIKSETQIVRTAGGSWAAAGFGMVHILPAAPLGTTDQMSPIRAADPNGPRPASAGCSSTM